MLTDPFVLDGDQVFIRQPDQRVSPACAQLFKDGVQERFFAQVCRGLQPNGWIYGGRSVFARQQQGGVRPVGFGDEPKFDACLEPVGGQDA